MTQFRDRTLSAASLGEIARHVEGCASCHRRYREAFQEKREPGPAWFGFSSDGWLKEEHLNDEQIVAYVGGGAEAEDCEIFEAHLRLCGRCRTGVESRRAHLHAKRERGTRWRHAVAVLRERGGEGGLWTRPAWALPALGLILLLLLLLGAIRWGRWGQTREPHPKETAAGPANANERAAAPVPEPSPGEASVGGAPSPAPRRKRPAPAEIARADVRRVRSEGRLERPPILDDLMMEPGLTRSDPRGDTEFRLVSPPQEVISENRPAFQWEGLRGATGYKVYVASPSDWKAIESPALDSTARSWTPPVPLRRGETYTWIVQAITPEGDVRIPSTAEPERRFKVLNARDFRRLRQLPRQGSPRLAHAILCAQMGLLRDAEAELLLLPPQGPDAALIARLLTQIRAWRQLQP